MKAIKIVYYSEPVDNHGRTESSAKGHLIYCALINIEDWTDDMVFEDEQGRRYSIDDLIGKTVCVPDVGIFKVPNVN
jgi:hypothetical protein